MCDISCLTKYSTFTGPFDCVKSSHKANPPDCKTGRQPFSEDTPLGNEATCAPAPCTFTCARRFGPRPKWSKAPCKLLTPADHFVATLCKKKKKKGPLHPSISALCVPKTNSLLSAGICSCPRGASLSKGEAREDKTPGRAIDSPADTLSQ